MKVLLNIKGGQEIGEKKDSIELLSQGEYEYNKDGTTSIIYKESELTGMGNTTTTILINNDEVLLKREGDVNTQLNFKEKDINTNYYESENGDFSITINTTKVNINLDEQGGEIKLEYKLNLNDGEATINIFEITVKPKI